MKPADNVQVLKGLADKIGRTVRLMEVCGTHTMSAFRTGLRSILPGNVQLISGPGCPVCVTPNRYLDKAVAISQRDDAIVTTFGDMLRVPGTEMSLEQARAGGANVWIVYSALEALALARAEPGRKVVFLGVGFETTVPGTAWALKQAVAELPNFSVLCAHKTMPNAMSALLSGGDVQIDGFLCPGHVSVIIGSRAYDFIARDHGIPCVVTGFEGPDMVKGIEMLLRQIADGLSEVEIQYTRTVHENGNPKARAVIDEVFRSCNAEWRGLGAIPGSGLCIRDAYAENNADKIFADVDVPEPAEPMGCRCGDVLRGVATPAECALFRTKCTPSNPVGACMVSSEGTCAAYYKYS